MERAKLIVRYVSLCFILILCFSGYVFPEDAPHIHCVNDGVTYDIYLAGTNFYNAFVYDDPYIINTYSSAITGYTVYQGTQRTVSFPVYDYGNMRINNTNPAQYVYFNQVTECEFIGFYEHQYWYHDLDYYLLAFLCIICLLTFLKR